MDTRKFIGKKLREFKEELSKYYRYQYFYTVWYKGESRSGDDFMDNNEWDEYEIKWFAPISSDYSTNIMLKNKHK